MSAPSFSSFPPSFSSFPDDEPGPSNRPTPDATSTRKSDKKHRKDKEDKHGRDKKGKSERKERHRSERTVDEEATRYFYSDKRGDQYNIQYGSLHEGDVPKYKSVSRGQRVLGLPSLLVLRRTGQIVELGTKRRHMPSLTDSKARAWLQHLLHVACDGDFLRLSSAQKKSSNEQSYRSITREHPNSDSEASSSSSSDLSEDDSSEDDEAITLTSHQEAVKSLEQTPDARPIPLSSKNAAKLRAEMTLSVVDRAIPLRLKYLRAGQEIWDNDQVCSEWETAYNIGGTQIWMEWLDWKIKTDGMKIKEEGIVSAVDAATKVLTSLGDDEEKEVTKIRLFWRLATAFRQAGFVEHANALFQAQAELTFQVPPALHGKPVSKLLDELEEFWDAEVPRIGEPDSQGWAQWISSGKKEAEPSDTPSPPPLPTSPDRYTQWARQESYTDLKSFIPSKSVNQPEDAEWDPYATVLFSDIRPLLLNLQTPLAQNVFRLTWLSFLGLHIPGFEEHYFGAGGATTCWDDRWCYTHLTSSSHLDALFPPKDASAYGVFDYMDSALHPEGLWGKVDVEAVDQPYVRRIFKQLRIGANDWEWDVLSLAFEAALNVKSALKLSRTYLASARDSLPLWAAHARMERRRGKLDEARKIYTTVLSSNPPVNQPWVGRLWWDWTETEWLAKQSQAATLVIMKAAGAEGTSGVALLRGKRMLEENFRRRDVEWKDREAWVKLRALLGLLNSGDIAQALSVFDAFHVDGVAEESLTVAALLFIYRHGVVLKNAMPPAILRERAAKALKMYPSNSVVLELFLEGEKGQGVWGRVRESLGGKDDVEKDLSRRLHEVWVGQWQVGRWESEVERIRSGLAAAVQSERTRGSPILWRVYIEFEIRAGRPKRAKGLLYRAIQECPISKELYLLAFDPLRSEFSSQELHDFVSAMAERGLRMRQEIEEDEEMRHVEAGVDDEKDSEMEASAKELRRLRPY
ncbi:hypothetical protein BDZ89DRAFT_1102857 [Hymenopellis radicata]|nr:hypothetical protein BDZ89DRAFT_1102857 [Hymenopellis radicata]